ncbi:MAG TPA: MoxR family ATPase, partial [Terriglobales bacterium]|nr:MoxR family ATPase [Terriglobales bacterium]
FFVLATLNPIEMEGTYPLPEAQLDRFFFKVVLSYPSHEQLQRIIGTTTRADLPQPEAVFAGETAAEQILAMRRLVQQVLVAPPLESYAATLVRATVPRSARLAAGDETAMGGDEQIERYVSFGSSPRGGQALLLGAKVRALMQGRVNVAYEDIDAVAVPALSHRLVLNYAAISDHIDPRALVARLIERSRQQR